MREVDEGKLAILKLRGWRFLFYPADLVEVFRPYEADGEMGEWFGAWNLPTKVEDFFESEFGDE